MRNISFLVFGFFLLFLLSCSSKEQKVGPGAYKIVKDTITYFCSEPVLADRFSCKTGAILGDPKVTDWKTTEKTMTKDVSCKFSHEELGKLGYSYTGYAETETRPSRPARIEEEGTSVRASNTGWAIPWEWLVWLVFIAIMLAVLLALLWLLRELFNWLMNQRVSSNPGSNNLVNNQILPQQPNPTGAVSNPVTPAPPCQGNNCACNQQALSVLQSMIDGKYSFAAPGSASVPEKGVYIGTRNEGDDLHIDIFSPEIGPAEEEKPKTNI